MKKRIILKRGIAYLLAVAMVVGLMVCTPSDMMNVQAADGTSTTTGKTITGLGTEAIADPVTPTGDSDAWKGSYVYFGTYDTDGDSTAEPVKYRVLDSNTTVYGGTTMLLDCDSVLWAGSDPSSAFDEDSNVWADSDIRTYLNGTFLTDNFSAAEQNAIAESTVASHVLTTDSEEGVNVMAWTKNAFGNYVALDRDKVLLLDAEDVSNGAYGYSQTDNGVTNRIKKDAGGNASWWLRSALTLGPTYAGIVNSVGSISTSYVDGPSVGVSPALNVNLSSVLFTSVISGTAGQTGAEYKLTLIDDNMTIAGNGTVTRNGDTVIIPYTISGTNSANATQVSVLLLDKEYTEGNSNDAEVIYYGALDDEDSFTLPSNLSDKVCGSNYYAYIVAEDVNGEKETDYASTPIKITIIEEIPENTETEEPTATIEEITKAPETEEPTTDIEQPTKAPEKEQPTTVIEETTENTVAEDVTTVTVESMTESTTEESTPEKPTSKQEEETTTLISEDNSTESEITSTNVDNTDDTGNSDKGGNGWIIWVILIIVILFVVILFLLFIIKKKKTNKEQDVTEENKDI